jgi:hypothetical protein
MHYLMLVTTSFIEGATTAAVRAAVYQALVSDDSFCGQGGRFGCPLADWFVIGGRWSGYLSTSRIGDAYREAVAARFPEQSEKPYGLVADHRKELDRIWESLGGQSPNPYSRDDTDDLGHPDDAQVLTKELYDALLSDFEGRACMSDGCHCEYVDLDGEALNSDFIGRKWLIVIDYHN